jgi:hypothetical protein
VTAEDVPYLAVLILASDPLRFLSNDPTLTQPQSASNSLCDLVSLHNSFNNRVFRRAEWQVPSLLILPTLYRLFLFTDPRGLENTRAMFLTPSRS